MRELGGVFFGTLVNDLDARPRLLPGLVDLLAHDDPRWRAFACEALGYLQWPDAVPHLRARFPLAVQKAEPTFRRSSIGIWKGKSISTI